VSESILPLTHRLLNVRCSYVGANAEIIEQQVTEVLEKAVNGVQGVKNITSSSSQGSSNITVEFELGVDLERAANDVREKVSQVSGQLLTRFGCTSSRCQAGFRCRAYRVHANAKQ